MCEPITAAATATAAASAAAGAGTAFAATAIPAAAAAAAAPAAAGFSWLSAASLASGVLGTGMSALGSMQQARYQAAVARNNQALAEQQAQDAERRGVIAEDQQRRRTGLIIGTQRASLAGQGTALDDGSPLDIVSDTAASGEMDALTIRDNATREAWGYRAQAANFAAQEQLASQQSGWLGTGASLLGGAMSVGDRWLRFRQAGVA
jgi:hypothetical protein